MGLSSLVRDESKDERSHAPCFERFG